MLKKGLIGLIVGIVVLAIPLYFFFTRKVNDFPSTSFDKVVAFKVDEYTYTRAGEGVVLTGIQKEKLVKIIQSNITYDKKALKCFNPRLSFVFYLDNHQVANALICLECKNMKTNPKLDNTILSRRGVYDISKLEQEIFLSRNDSRRLL